MIIHKPKQHGNANKPSTETLRKARERGPDGTMPAESRYLRSEAWQPLAGSAPVTLTDRKGCCWPVTVEPPHLFCNLPLEPGAKLPYCADHSKRYLSKEATK